MSKAKTDSGVVSPWKMGTVGFLTATLISLALVRISLWYFLIYREDFEIISNGVCYISLPLILLTAVPLFVAWTVCYKGYLNLAERYPADIHGVKMKYHGNPLGKSLVLFFVGFLIFWIISIAVLYFSQGLDLKLDTDMIVMRKLLITLGATLVADLLVLIMNDSLFKPAIVVNN